MQIIESLIKAIIISISFIGALYNFNETLEIENILKTQNRINKELKQEITNLKQEITNLKQEITNLKQNRISKPIEVTVTAYSPQVKETDDTPFKTAFQKKVKAGTVAVSRDLFLKGWTPGKKIYIYQIGVFNISSDVLDVYDLMAEEREDGTKQTNHVDIFFFSTEQAKEFGIKKSKAILLELQE